MKQYRTYAGKARKAVMLLALAALPAAATASTQKEKATASAPKAAAGAEQPKPATGEKKALTKGAWSVRMSKNTPRTFTVKANEALMSDVAADLGKLLKVQIFLSPLMEKQRVSLDFSGMTLEAAIRMLAPHPYVDYEAGGEDQGQAKPLAIYLNALNERPPSKTAVVKGNSEALLVEGDTEEGVGDAQAQKQRDEVNPLKVSFNNNLLSVRARKQPLTIVLFRIASEIGVPFEMRYESPEVVDVDFNNYSLEQAVRSLSPAVKLFYRLDLQTYEAQPLRIVLVAPSTVKS